MAARSLSLPLVGLLVLAALLGGALWLLGDEGGATADSDGATGERGDQFVVIKIVPPKDMSDEATELLKQFDDLVDDDPRDGLW